MTSFASIPATSETDWTDWAFRLQFWTAIDEIRRAAGTYSLGHWGEASRMEFDETLAGIGNEPPESPADGERWAVDWSPVGDWEDHSSEIATYNGSSSWTFEEPSEDILVKIDGTPWRRHPTQAEDGFIWRPVLPGIADIEIYFPNNINPVSGTEYRSYGGDHWLAPGYLQRMLQSAAPFYIPNNVPNDYSGLTAPPKPWGMPSFWEAVGLPADARGDEAYDKQATSPPSDPYDGMTCLVMGDGSYSEPPYGDFAGHAGEVATYDEASTSWSFASRPSGHIAWVGGDAYKLWGGEWVEIGWHDSDYRFGWTRKFPRTLSRLDDPGEAGQRARFTGPPSRLFTHTQWLYNKGAGTRFSMDPVGDIPDMEDGMLCVFGAGAHPYPIYTYPGLVTVHQYPSAMGYYLDGDTWVKVDGLYYEHDGTGWVLSADQTSPPDLVTSYGPAKPGDYMGPWIWNEMATAIGLLTRRCINVNFMHTAALGVSETGETWAAAKAAAESEWSGGSTPSWTTDYSPDPPGPRVYNTADGPDEARMMRDHRKMFATATGDYFARTTQVDWYAMAETYGKDNSYYDTATFSSHGDDVADGTYTLAETATGPAATEDYEMPWQFDRILVAPNSPWTSEQAEGDVACTGYQVVAAFAIEENAVSGGFTYT